MRGGKACRCEAAAVIRTLWEMPSSYCEPSATCACLARGMSAAVKTQLRHWQPALLALPLLHPRQSQCVCAMIVQGVGHTTD